MATRSVPAGRTSKRKPDRPNPAALRARFLGVAVRKVLGHLQDARDDHPLPPDSAERMRGLRWLAPALWNLLWCLEAERILDSATDFLRDHGDYLPQEDREALEKDVETLLGEYQRSC